MGKLQLPEGMDLMRGFKHPTSDKTINERIDEFEVEMSKRPPVNCPVNHKFVPGMYIREIFMPKNTWVTSLVHKTNHPFFILKGKVSIYSDNNGEQKLEAPYSGITTPCTRRLIFNHEDTIWVTCHPTNVLPTDHSQEAIMEAVSRVDEDIIEQRINPLLGGTIINNIVTKQIK